MSENTATYHITGEKEIHNLNFAASAFIDAVKCDLNDNAQNIRFEINNPDYEELTRTHRPQHVMVERINSEHRVIGIKKMTLDWEGVHYKLTQYTCDGRSVWGFFSAEYHTVKNFLELVQKLPKYLLKVTEKEPKMEQEPISVDANESKICEAIDKFLDLADADVNRPIADWVASEHNPDTFATNQVNFTTKQISRLGESDSGNMSTLLYWDVKGQDKDSPYAKKILIATRTGAVHVEGYLRASDPHVARIEEAFKKYAPFKLVPVDQPAMPLEPAPAETVVGRCENKLNEFFGGMAIAMENNPEQVSEIAVKPPVLTGTRYIGGDFYLKNKRDDRTLEVVIFKYHNDNTYFVGFTINGKETVSTFIGEDDPQVQYACKLREKIFNLKHPAKKTDNPEQAFVDQVADVLDDLALRFIRMPELVIADVGSMPVRTTGQEEWYTHARFRIERKCFNDEDMTGISLQYDEKNGVYEVHLFKGNRILAKQGVLNPANCNMVFACCLINRIVAEKERKAEQDKPKIADRPKIKDFPETKYVSDEEYFIKHRESVPVAPYALYDVLHALQHQGIKCTVGKEDGDIIVFYCKPRKSKDPNPQCTEGTAC